MCKFEFKTYKQKKETVETFEDSVCNGIPKGRRMLKKAFEDNAECAEFWLHGDPNESGEYRRSVLVFALWKATMETSSRCSRKNLTFFIARQNQIMQKRKSLRTAKC